MRSMKNRFIAGLCATAVLPVLAIGFGVSSASAVTSDAVTETIIDASLSGLGTESIDPALMDLLQEDITLAVEEGVIDPAIIEVVEEVVTEPTTTPDPEATTPVVDPELTDLIDENLSEETGTWEEEAPAWMAAFEQIRADFEACRTDGQATSACARTLGFQLQIAHAEAELAQIDTAIADIANLPEEEQAAALAELEAQRAAFQAKLERSSAKLASAIESGSSAVTPADQARLNSVLGEVRGRSLAPALPEQAQQNQQGSQQGNSGAVTPETPAQGGSVNVDPAPGNSGNGGRPAAPGSQGQGKSNNNR
jgi:hypothetical protein